MPLKAGDGRFTKFGVLFFKIANGELVDFEF